MLNKSPEFRIDGNFGGASAIVQAIMQSVNGEIVLLPALPDEWGEGHVYGLRAIGGFTIDIDWQNGKLKSARITSDYDGVCRICGFLSIIWLRIRKISAGILAYCKEI